MERMNSELALGKWPGPRLCLCLCNVKSELRELFSYGLHLLGRECTTAPSEPEGVCVDLRAFKLFAGNISGFYPRPGCVGSLSWDIQVLYCTVVPRTLMLATLPMDGCKLQASPSLCRLPQTRDNPFSPPLCLPIPCYVSSESHGGHACLLPFPYLPSGITGTHHSTSTPQSRTASRLGTPLPPPPASRSLRNNHNHPIHRRTPSTVPNQSSHSTLLYPNPASPSSNAHPVHDGLIGGIVRSRQVTGTGNGKHNFSCNPPSINQNGILTFNPISSILSRSSLVRQFYTCLNLKSTFNPHVFLHFPTSG